MDLAERIAGIFENSDQAKRLLEKSTAGIFISILTGLTVLLGLAGKVFEFNKLLALWLSHALTTDPGTKAPELKLWFVPFVFLILLVTASLILMIIWTIKQNYVMNKEKIALNDVMGSVRQIRDQAQQTRIKAWDLMTFRYLINKDFSGSQTRIAVMRAIDVPVHFWESVNTVEDEADAAESFTAISYRVRDADSPLSNIVHLPSENGKRCKKACLFFLPPLQPGATRKFETFFQWPGMFNRLKRVPEDIEFTTNTREVLPLYQLEVYIEDGTRKRLDCKITGDPYPTQTLTPGRYEVNGWKGHGYIYRVTDIPAGNLRLVLKTELKD